MRLLLGLAALASIATISTSSAYALDLSRASRASAPQPRYHSPLPTVHRNGPGHIDEMPVRHDRRGHGRGDFAGGVAYGYGDYSDFDGNRSFDPNMWNDWWHERPERAFPRWMSHNRDCARLWYSGDVLTC